MFLRADIIKVVLGKSPLALGVYLKVRTRWVGATTPALLSVQQIAGPVLATEPTAGPCLWEALVLARQSLGGAIEAQERANRSVREWSGGTGRSASAPADRALPLAFVPVAHSRVAACACDVPTEVRDTPTVTALEPQLATLATARARLHHFRAWVAPPLKNSRGFPFESLLHAYRSRQTPLHIRSSSPRHGDYRVRVHLTSSKRT
jgi:hypothetical protein